MRRAAAASETVRSKLPLIGLPVVNGVMLSWAWGVYLGHGVPSW